MNKLPKEKRIKRIGISLLAFLLFCAAFFALIGQGNQNVYAAPAKGYFTGVDVSDHNGTINWEAAKAGGIDFAIIRIGWGDDLTSQDDRSAERNMRECERLGIPYGVYIYSYALTENEVYSEALHTIRKIQGHYPALGVWFDMEDADDYKKNHNFSPYTHGADLTKFCLDYVRYMKGKVNVPVGVYANPDYFRRVLNYDWISAEGLIWIAHWEVDRPAYDGAVWQYSAEGRVYGNSGVFDMNRIYQGSPLYHTVLESSEPADYTGYYQAIQSIPNNLNEYTEESVANLYATIDQIPKDYAKGAQAYLDELVQGIYQAIAALDCAHRHMLHTEAVDPTCTGPGCDEYWSCGFCGGVFWDPAGVVETTVEETVLPPVSHQWSRWAVKQFPTEAAEGYMERNCLLCGATETRQIPPGTSMERGDVNRDGVITSADLSELARYVARIKELPDADTYMIADVDGNGSVDAGDMTHLAKFVAHIIPQL